MCPQRISTKIQLKFSNRYLKMGANKFAAPVLLSINFPPIFQFLLLLLLPILPNAISSSASSSGSSSSVLDNGVVGDPVVECMDDRVKIIFRTQRPFVGRIFVKGMVENENCVRNYEQNTRPQIDFELTNGQCNMRRSRKLGPEQRGVEQSITIIISFHQIFITKIDRSFRCTCFFMEADKVVTNRFDVSDQATTELIDTARMPLCSYTVRRGSISGPIVTYASVGEQVFHVWQCESDLFSMLVHNCFVDDGAGKDRKPLIDEQGCSTDTVILSELTYNSQANLAYSEVNVFKFADKVTTYFQCAVSTCMISEGMCSGKTPPHCGPNSRIRRTINGGILEKNGENSAATNVMIPFSSDDPFTMDLSAEKIVVLDLDDSAESESSAEAPKSLAGGKSWRKGQQQNQAILAATSRLASASSTFASTLHPSSICFGEIQFGIILAGVGLLAFGAFSATGVLIWRQRKAKKSWSR